MGAETRKYDQCFCVQEAASTYDYADTANINMAGYGDTEYSPEYGDTAKTYTAGYGVAKYDMEYGNIAKKYIRRDTAMRNIHTGDIPVEIRRDTVL